MRRPSRTRVDALGDLCYNLCQDAEWSRGSAWVGGKGLQPKYSVAVIGGLLAYEPVSALLGGIMLEAIVALVGTLIGVLLGFWLSEMAQSRREDREEKRQAKSVRALVSLEIQQNLQQLEEFWRKVSQLDGPIEDEDLRQNQLARRVMELPFASMHREAFESQLSRLPAALSTSLLLRTFEAYKLMARLEVLREALESAARVQDHDRDLATQINTRGLFWGSRRFDRDAPSFFDEFGDIVERLIADGNPLHSQD